MISLGAAASTTRRCWADPGSAGKHAEIERLQMSERIIRPIDQQDGLPRLDFVSIVERLNLELGPLDGTELQDRNRLVHAAEERRDSFRTPAW